MDEHMDPVVLKITFCGIIHRLTVPAGDVRSFSFSQLQSSARELVGLLPSATATFTYVDRDGDVIALARDADVKDALLVQGLNPLRIAMTRARGASEDFSPIAGAEQDPRQDPEQSQTKKFAQPLHNVGTSFSSLSINQQAAVISTQRLDVPSSQNRPEPLPIRNDAATEQVASQQEGPFFPNPLNFSAAYKEGIVKRNSVLYVASDGKAYGNFARDGASSAKRDDQQDVPVSNGVATEADKTHNGANSNDAWKVVHFGVGCDECGMNPIQGSRYVSYKKTGFNLCSACYKRRDGDVSVHYFHGCDKCDKYPIKGIVYKSVKKSNYDLCQACFDTRTEFEQGNYVEKNRGFFRLDDPGLVDMESLTSVVTVKVENECRQVLHNDIMCHACGMKPIRGRRCRSYESLDYDLCLACFEKGHGKDDKPQVYRGTNCDGCDVIPIRGRRYNNSRKKVKNGCGYDLCGECFDKRDEAEQAGYVEISRGFYWLVHPALVGNEGSKRGDGSKHGSSHGSGQFSEWLSVASSTLGIVSNLN